MRVSVIIPTYNRAEVLRKTLEGYAKQTGDHRIHELLVLDDGSSDHTRAAVAEMTAGYPLALRYLHQDNAGLSAARNHAFREAEGDLILFGDDDIIPGPRLVAEHVAWHRKHPQPEVGVLGFVDWAPEVDPTPFMIWCGLHGPQFSFGQFTPGMELDFRYGYFCNTSVKASFLREHGLFNEDFRKYGWEDLELSHRLSLQGYRLLYNPAAIGFHNKFERFENTRARVEKLYQAWPFFVRTDAGKRFLELWSAQRGPSPSAGAVKKLLRPLKSCAMFLLRPLVDTRLPLPNRIYDMVFYHYLTPFASYVAATPQSAIQDKPGAGLRVGAPVSDLSKGSR